MFLITLHCQTCASSRCCAIIIIIAVVMKKLNYSVNFVYDQQTPVQVTVSVEDTNDYEPEFVGGPFNFVTREASMLRVLVDTIAANDADAGINAEVRFAIIAGNADGSFFIDDITVRTK